MHSGFHKLLWTTLLALLCAAVSPCTASVFISEFMADNDTTLLDIDGDASDWIELYNDSSNTVNLTGWHLTDDATNLVQWTFPSTNIEAKGYLVVFASGKNRSVAGVELHTNFKLSADGEQLALVGPDGVTVEDLHVFGSMPEDVSYGYPYGEITDNAVQLDAGGPCKAHIPTGPFDVVGWQQPGFNDSSWLSGTTGVGYENSSGYENLIGLDVSAMSGVNPSIYIRVPFEVENAVSVRRLILKMKYDDGFVAYLNGTKVQSVNLAQSTAWNSPCQDHLDSLALVYEEFDLTSYAGLLNEGTNLLAMQGMNESISSSDLLFVPRIEAGYADRLDTSSSGLLETPTPGSANSGISYEGVVEVPTAQPERGFYEASFQVVLSNRTAGASIRYTLDGSEPTTNSPVYSGALTISGTTTLRTKAFIAGWKPSFPSTHTYIFLDDIIAQSRNQTAINNNPIITGMDASVLSNTYYDASGQVCTVRDALLDIPSLSVVTDDKNLYSVSSGIYVNPAQRWERPASLELINPDGSEGFQINAGLRIRGGWSRHDGYAKHAFRLLFGKEYGAGKLHYPLFEDEGVDTFDNIDLRTSMNYNWTYPFEYPNPLKNTFLRDVFCRDSMGVMKAAYTRSRYYHLYLNGRYWGLYMTEERPEASYAASYFGGDPADYDVIKTTSWVDTTGWWVAPWYVVEATDGTLDAYNRLYAAAMAGFTNNADYFSVQGLNAAGQPDPTKEKLLDADSLIDYLLLIYYTGASDNNISVFLGNALNNLYAIYNREDPDGFKWVQHDCEHALDTSTQLDRTGPFTDWHLQQAQYFNPQTLHEKLLANSEYRILFSDHVYRHFRNNGALTQANCESRLDFRQAQIDRAIIANAARWGSTSLDRDTWLTASASARAFFAGRADAVIGYLNADGILPSIEPPHMGPAGGYYGAGTLVNLSASEGTIYYTTDGSDPRAIGGAISGTAYSAPISISVPTKVKARTRSASGEWSALCEAVYWTDDVPLAVTELMYHAPGGNQQDFIEIRNISNHIVDLYGYKLDGGIDFKLWKGPSSSLAPGEFLVVVKDIDSFASTYTTNGISIAGEYKGDLDNSGETVELEFWNNDLISFRYSDARNWPQAADGAGHSLVPLDSTLCDEACGSLNYGGNWRASTYFGGSPGFEDPDPQATVVLNEIVAHTDTGEDPPFDSNDQIELFNPAGFAVSLDGWYLSDDLADPQKWAIPTGTVIPAQGFALFDEDDFHPGRTNGFGLDKAGEELVLSAPDRVADAIRFKGQENGASLGRYPDGAPDWLVTLPTPDSPNQLADQPVWISELMYNPPAPAGYANGDVVEYIQLQNQTASTIQFENATGSWRIDGGVSYTFPGGFILPAGERLWIVSFDPTDTALLNLFCNTYALDAAGETILGPYAGHLSNEGERVAVERPQASDDPLKPLDISWVVVDELFYFDQAPWPAEADGTGYPLLRTALTQWGVTTPYDTDADQLDDAWENSFFGSLLQNGNDDPDFDFFSNLEESIAGTNPTNPASYFKIDRIEAQTVEWTAVKDRSYSIYWTSDLAQPFSKIGTSAYPQNYFIDTAHGTNLQGFYRLGVEFQSGKGSFADQDGDGMSDYEEWVCGTDPGNPDSYFTIGIDNMTNYIWTAIPGRSYSVYWTDDLRVPFVPIATGLFYPQSNFTDSVHSTNSQNFYRLEVELH